MHFISLKYYLFVEYKQENSGNRSGQRNKGDIDFGHVAQDQSWLGSGGEEFVGQHNRKKIIGEKPHVLYFWQLNGENNLLSRSLAKLSDNEKVNSDNLPSTTSPAEHKNYKTNEKGGNVI